MAGLFDVRARLDDQRRKSARSIRGRDGTKVSVDLEAGTITVGRDTHSLADVAVQLDEPNGSRVTATRVVMLGVFALAARKRDTPYLSIEGPGWAADIEVFRTKTLLDQARSFVQQVGDWQRGVTRYRR